MDFITIKSTNTDGREFAVPRSLMATGLQVFRSSCGFPKSALLQYINADGNITAIQSDEHFFVVQHTPSVTKLFLSVPVEATTPTTVPSFSPFGQAALPPFSYLPTFPPSAPYMQFPGRWLTNADIPAMQGYAQGRIPPPPPPPRQETPNDALLKRVSRLEQDLSLLTVEVRRERQMRAVLSQVVPRVTAPTHRSTLTPSATRSALMNEIRSCRARSIPSSPSELRRDLMREIRSTPTIRSPTATRTALMNEIRNHSTTQMRHVTCRKPLQERSPLMNTRRETMRSELLRAICRNRVEAEDYPAQPAPTHTIAEPSIVPMPSVEAEPYFEQLQLLQAMGFDPETTRIALRECNGRLEDAIATLFGEL